MVFSRPCPECQRYRVVGVIPGPAGEAGENHTILYGETLHGLHDGNVFYVEPAFYRNLVTRTFTGQVIDTQTQQHVRTVNEETLVALRTGRVRGRGSSEAVIGSSNMRIGGANL